MTEPLPSIWGNGDGTFQTQKTYNVGSAVSSVAIADFNGDGIPDLAVGYDNGVDGLSILQGNGDGTFQAPQAISAGTGTDDIIVGDFNADGKLDIAVTNYEDSTVTILLGNGDGTFQTPVPYTSGTGSVNGNVVGYVVEADLNRDGILDLVASNNGDGTVSVFLGNGDGTFQAQQIYTAGPGALGLALGDLNGDGFVDLVVASDLADTSDTNYSLFILLGNGDGSLQAPTAVQIPPVAGAARCREPMSWL